MILDRIRELRRMPESAPGPAMRLVLNWTGLLKR